VKIEVSKPPYQIATAIELIERSKKINRFTYDLILHLDYRTDSEAGSYDPRKPNVITVNPFLCSLDDATFSYLEDNTLFGIILHEFSHFLTMTYFVDFKKNYLEAFPEQRLLVTKYEAANEDYDEEMAEICSLQIRNPFLLKLISKNHYKFFKAWFKSPVMSSEKHFLFMYNKLPIDCKNRLRTKWGIIVNHAEQKVYIDPDIKQHPTGFIVKP
jgi:hypothetical protein